MPRCAIDASSWLPSSGSPTGMVKSNRSIRPPARAHSIRGSLFHAGSHAVTLARLHRAGELTGVWAPDPAHEAVRDLARAREAAGDDLRRKRQQLLSFLLRHSRIYSGGGHWTLAHRRWLAGQKFDHAAQQIVFQEGIDAIEDSLQRLRRLAKQLALIVPEWSMAPVVGAYQAMRGASFLVAVTFAAEIGDVRRFDTPRQLMSFLGLVPAESSTGDTVRRKGLTLAGSRRARRALIEAAWTYRYPARVSETLRARLEGLPKPVRDIAWKAQVRLCARYRRLSATGKKPPVVVAAIAREMAAFLSHGLRIVRFKIESHNYAGGHLESVA